MVDSVFDLAKQGDAKSTEQIVVQYSKLAYCIAREWVRKGVLSYDDAISEANLALMQCIRGSYDASKGKFSSYLARAVDNRIRMYIRHEKKDLYVVFADSTVSLEDGDIDVIETLVDYDVCVEEQVGQIVQLEQVKDVLLSIPAIEVECLMLRFSGMTSTEVAAQLGICQSYVSRLSNTAMRKLKEEVKKRGMT